MEENSKEVNGSIISGILNDINNCNDCPLFKTCNIVENEIGDSLCTMFKSNDSLDIII